ncbi:MAG: permease-like cell division protein FtsX [Alloprevotella sp.]|nr:permease-like cell division protein FtsX [Prevotella sp.]MBR1712762.1 permease-like cell division protein FtsX [Alloprevotella sp.]
MANKKRRTGGRFNTLTSCISTTMVLLLLGVVVLFTLLAHSFSRALRENFMVEVLMDDATPHAELLRMQSELRAAPYARHVAFLSKERGAEEMSKVLGADAVEFQGVNPIPAEFEVYLRAEYANRDSIARFEPALRKNAYVTDVVYPQNAIEAVNGALPVVGLVLLVVAVLLTVVSFALINNTVRMSVYARRESIHTMKLAGAKWGFIRRPFLWRALGMGVVSVLLAGGLLAAGMYFLWQLDFFLSRLLTTFVAGVTLGTVLVAGLLLTVGCAFFSVSRFLRMDEEDVFLK